MAPVNSLEWQITDVIVNLCKELKCKELISLEGIAAVAPDKTKIYFYSNQSASQKKFTSINLEPLKEGLIMGVSGALLLKAKTPLSCIFVESHMNMADSRAAAKVIEVLDKYLKLKVDPSPLIKTAQEFEAKLKTLLQKNQELADLKPVKKDKKQLGYIG